jgi:hypothetical protein
MRSLRARDTSSDNHPRVTFQVDPARLDGTGLGRGSGNVTASVAPIGSGHQPAWHYEISWSVGQSGVPLVFAGCLCIEPHEDYNAFYLRLTADCREPRAACDPLYGERGHAIGKATIATILLAIANDIEQQYRLDERAKLARAKPASTAPHT